MSQSNDIPIDAAWAPHVPIGHTSYTWLPSEDVEVKSDEILPKAGERNILITSALPYVNNVPHLGNIIGCVLSADVYSRFCALRGYNKLFICGTDEYGTATETKAQQEGLTPQQICDKYHAIHAKVYEWFDIKFDYFGRTTTPLQTEIAQDIFQKCDQNNFVISDSVEQLYCNQCTRFLADRYVAGTCPLCAYPDAKGDQCDKCSQLINAVELKHPKCTVCGSTPEIRTSQHLFLDLPKLEPRLRAFVEERKGQWSENSVQVTNSWLQEGLKPRCITRDLKWGTPVPKDGYRDKVFYVWFDAPIGYISITANYTRQWEQWWKSANVELVQFMGKDNVPFHTVIFPCTQLAAADGYTMLQTLSTTEYLNYEGTKFSKTRGVGVFGSDVMDTGIPVEIWRYYLLHNRPEKDDTMFLWDDFAAKANTDLPNNLGNLVQRSLAFIKSRLDGVIPPLTTAVAAAEAEAEAEAEAGMDGSELTAAERELETEVSELLCAYVGYMDEQRIKDALKTAMRVSDAGNRYMQTQKPWDLFKTAPARCHTALHVIAQLVYLLAILVEPFMPSVTHKILEQLGTHLPRAPLATLAAVAWPLTLEDAHKRASGLFLPAGHRIGTPAPIFKKVEPTAIEALRRRFQGSQSAPVGAEDGQEFPLAVRVGQVQEVAAHPNNPKCYVLKVNTGEQDVRQVVCNWVDAYTPAQLKDSKLCVLTNLKPSKFGGVVSQGLALTAVRVTDHGSVPVPLRVDAPVGTLLLPKGYKYAPVKTFDVKAKLASLMLSVGPAGAALCGGAPLLAADKAVTVDDVSEGSRIC